MKATSFFSTIIAAFAVIVLVFSGMASAVETPYSKAAFDKLMAEGKPVIVDFYADWCPTCKTQRPLVKALADDPKMKDVTVFIADYDKEKELKKALRVSSQSTFVVLKGGKEVARSTGQTRKDDIAATFAKAL